MNIEITENFSKELRVAIEAAQSASRIINKYYSGGFKVTIKEDQTPVTEVDVKAENMIKNIILENFPAHGFYGEETSRENKEADFLWLVDPIDGTKSFVRGYPFFSTQIALMNKGKIILGVSNAPIFNELVYAESGKGAWMANKQLSVSDINQLDSATLSTGNLKSLASSQGWSDLGKIISTVDRIRGYGDFYHYHLLAAGKIDAVIESDVNILDIAALSIIINEAGGLFTDLDGNFPCLETRSVLAANPQLHASLQKYLVKQSVI